MTEYINLEGTWNLEGYGDIKIPGTTDEAKYNNIEPEFTTKHLYRPHPWLGEARYTREVEIPHLAEDAKIYFEIERSRYTHVYIDGVCAGECDNMLTRQLYDLTGKLAEGKHTITVAVNNNVHECADYCAKILNSHHFTDNTQTNWNGMLGNVRLIIESGIRLDIKSVSLKDRGGFTLALGFSHRHATINVSLDGEAYYDGTVDFENGEAKLFVPFKGNERLWNEHDPYRYKLTVQAECGGEKCKISRMQGFRYLSVSGKKILINGERVFLRGKHDACVFPLTGYAPMDVDEWVRIFQIAKSYGINHYRCHSWCPPEAAYEAADICGIYFQAELPQSGGIVFEEGDVNCIFSKREGIKLLDEYASHPSFIMLSLGNEICGSREAFNNIISLFKSHRDDILYTQGSNNFLMHQYPIENEDVFVSNQIVEGNEITNLRASFAHCDMPLGHFQSKDDIGTSYFYPSKSVIKPIVTHEVGEYQFFPDYEEISKYTGVTRADNLAYFKNLFYEKGLGGYEKAFAKASGHTAVLGYREDIEAAMRSDDISGFQLLDIQDFPGQGTALVGILDAFMDSKGIITPEDWRRFCNHTVILAVFDKYVYKAGEAFKADIYLHNYSGNDIADKLCITLGTNEYTKDVKVCSGSTQLIAKVNFNMPENQGEHTLMLTLGSVCNDYKLYAYDADYKHKTKAVYSKDLTEQMLSENKSLIVIASDMDKGAGIEGFFATDFWCWPMFENINKTKGLHAPGTLGLLVDNAHPALSDFESGVCSDNRWRETVSHSKSIILDGTGIEPIVRTIDNVSRNHSLGLVFELKVNSCNVLVCGSDLLKLQKTNPASRALLASLDDYASSLAFSPEKCTDFNGLNKLLTRSSAVEAEKGDFSMFFSGDSEM